MSHARESVPSPRLLILCPEVFERGVRAELCERSGVHWERQSHIQLSVVRPFQGDQSSRIRACCQERRDALLVLAFGGIKVDPAGLAEVKSQIVWADRPTSLRAFQRMLPRILHLLLVDLVGITVQNVGGAWEHGVVDRDKVHAWLDQFHKVGGSRGDYRWLGQRLLAALDFWSPSRLMETLDLTPQGVQDLDAVCLNLNRPEKSAGSLANKIRKRLDAQGITLPIEDVHRALSEGRRTRILYVEDCIMSGNEMLRVLGGLLGNDDAWGTPRTSALENPDQLKEVCIRIRCGVVSNAGFATVCRFLRERGLHNVAVDIPRHGLLQVFTQAGLRAIEDGAEFDQDGCIVDQERYVQPYAFRDYGLWGTTRQMDLAREFCSTVGRQLYSHYQNGRPARPARWLDEAALGVRSFGMALAFSHSVPKETLPVFWAEGPVEFGGKRTQWLPLFPSAM